VLQLTKPGHPASIQAVLTADHEARQLAREVAMGQAATH